MDIRYWENFALSVDKPSGSVDALAFGAMPVAARTVRAPLVAAVVTARFIAAEGGGTTQLNSPQRPVLLPAQGQAVALQEGVAMLAHHIGEFELRAAHDN
jgi:hypothetical protein